MISIPGDVTTAATISVGGTVSNTIEFAGDLDWYRVTLTAGVTYRIKLDSASGAGRLVDPLVQIRDSFGAFAREDDDSGIDHNSLLWFTPSESGTYYISAGGFETGTGAYVLNLASGFMQDPLDTLRDAGYNVPSSMVSYYFAAQGESLEGRVANRDWSDDEKAVIASALAAYSAVLNLSFVPAATAAAATFVFMVDDFPSTNTIGSAQPPGPGQAPQIIRIDADSAHFERGTAPGGNFFATILHEIGHALGLAHPHDDGPYGASQVMEGVIDEFNSYGQYGLNQGVFTTMTYNDGWPSNFPSWVGSTYQATPMALDIAVLQQLYGAKTTTAVGDDTYTLPTSTGTGVAYRAIWDAGGSDRIVYGGSRDATIDLRPATLRSALGGGGYVSYASGVDAGFTIANGVYIENARGGSGADTLTGNGANNVLEGALGNDRLIGGSGTDWAAYSGVRAAYTITNNGPGSATVSGPDGFDTITSVERLRFSNQTIAIGTAAPQDFDGDGNSDILWRNSDGTILQWQMVGRTVSSENFVANVGAAWSIAGTGDFNGDGHSDILWRNADGTILQWQMIGRTIAAERAIARVGSAWALAGNGDFNGDGKQDLLWRNTDGSLLTWQMNGSTIAAEASLGQIGIAWSIAGKGDFNADGNTDLLWRNTDGTLIIWQMNGTQIASEGSLGLIGNAWNISGIGDFDGDGDSDILWRHNDGSMLMWNMNNRAIASEGSLGRIGLSWTVNGTGDYAGDGKADILWRNSDGAALLWTMNGSAIASEGSVGTIGTSWTISPTANALAMVA